ncbi:MAG TPA: phospholipid carrier-dependent glycosyltransferase [Mycobacteriales bacterium]|nr:phospholipid carrier-dependent glycosyltransferase [Mycobacteriales bacterium]
MSVSDYLFGSLALSIGLLPWLPAARRLVRRLAPDWQGAEGVLASSLVAVTGVIVVAELLGLAGGLRRWPFAVVSAAVAGVVALNGSAPPSRRTRERSLRLPASRGARVMLGCVVICVAATTASVIGRDAAVLHTGPLDTDSVHYHLTQAALMVRTHSDVHQHHLASSDGTVYYPYDAELLDAVAMLGPRPDIAVYGLNLLFGWLALLACWVIGARWSAGAPALAAGAAVIALPIVSQASTGPGLNDLPAMAFVVAAVACLAVAGVPRGERPLRRWTGELCLAGLALGLAAGTKLNALPMAALIAVAVVVLTSGDRRRVALALFAPAFLAGGFWYVRDWVIVGSPVPDTNLTVAGHGFHVVPYPQVKPYAFTVAHYLGNGSVIRHWFAPGLRTVWTDLWPVMALLFVTGVVIAVVAESGLRRMLGLAVALGFAVYLVTPTTAMGSDGAPLLFATNTRYVLPELLVAVVILASASALRRFGLALTVFFTALMIGLLSFEDLPQQVSYAEGVAGALVLLGVVAWFAVTRAAARRGMRIVMASALVVAAIAGGAAVQRSYLRHRYVGGSDLAKLFAFMGSHEDQRIGVVGHGLEYGMLGPRFANSVNYVGVTAPSQAFDLPMSCPALIETLQRLTDDYVVVEPLVVEHTDRVNAWLAAIPGVREVFANTAGTVYRVPREIPDDGCGSSVRIGSGG